MPLARDKRQNKMARGSLVIQQKGNQWSSSCFFCSYPASVYPVKHPGLPACQSPPKSVEELRWGLQLPGAPTSEERFEARNSDSKNHKHLTFPLSALKILLFAFASHRLLSGLKELCKFQPLHIFSLPLCFPITPLPQSPQFYCSDYFFSISCRLHDRASPSLLLFLLSPG